MGKFKDLITIEITIEQAVKAIARSSGDNEDVVIKALAQILFIEAEIPKSGFIGRGYRVSRGKSPLVQNGFHLLYKKYDKPTIPEEKYIRVICRMKGDVISGYLFDVAEKGWGGTYVDQAQVPIVLITKEKDKEPVEEKYTGEPIPFREFEARITSFEKLLDKNNMPIPENWVDDESIKNEKDIDISKLYNPRKTIYKQVWKELIKINNSGLNDIDNYGWEGIVSRMPLIKHDEENGLISGTDEFGEPDDIDIKSFQNTFSTMKQRLKNRKI